MPDAWRDQSEGSESLELELQVAVSYIWVLGITPRSCGRAASAPTRQVISPCFPMKQLRLREAERPETAVG